MRTNLTVEKLWLFGLFSGDKDDNIDMKMIKITIKAHQIDMGLLLISKVDNIQKLCLSIKSGFFISLLGCEFYPHGQTWYQSFISQPKRKKKKESSLTVTSIYGSIFSLINVRCPSKG